MTAPKVKECALCGERVLVKHPAWYSHLFGWQVHLACVEREGPGWYGRLIARNG